MIRNYLIIALRNFWRHKIFSIINILGLAIGISAALVIYLIVQYELSYEKWQPEGDRIYRVVTNMHFPEMDFKNGGVPGPLPDAVRADIPGIEESSAFYTGRIESTTIPVNGTEGKKFKRQ